MLTAEIKEPSDEIAYQPSSSDCGEKQTCSECRGTPGCRWCSSPGADLSSRCNSMNETAKVCPVQGVEKTVSMDPTPIPKPYWYKINDAGFPPMIRSFQSTSQIEILS